MSKVRGFTTIVEATPTLDTNAYSTGDFMGTVMTLTDVCLEEGSPVTLLSLSVVDAAKQSVEMDVLLFDELPTVASADNAAIDITDAQMLKCKGWVNIATTDYKAVANSSVACVKNIGLVMKPNPVDTTAGRERSLYAVLICRGSPTYAASSLLFTFSFAQD